MTCSAGDASNGTVLGATVTVTRYRVPAPGLLRGRHVRARRPALWQRHARCGRRPAGPFVCLGVLGLPERRHARAVRHGPMRRARRAMRVCGWTLGWSSSSPWGRIGNDGKGVGDAELPPWFTAARDPRYLLRPRRSRACLCSTASRGGEDLRDLACRQCSTAVDNATLTAWANFGYRRRQPAGDGGG